jgi:hypothetical protein
VGNETKVQVEKTGELAGEKMEDSAIFNPERQATRHAPKRN